MFLLSILSCKVHTFELSEAPIRGHQKTILVQFTDFDCASCKAVQTSLHALRVSHPDVGLAFKSFALSESPQGLGKHLIARCVYEQDKSAFWLYHDLLFSDSPPREATPEAAAELLGLNAVLLRECAAAPRTRERIMRDREEGLKAGVTGTPTFFLGSARIEGFQSVQNLRQFVETNQ